MIKQMSDLAYHAFREPPWNDVLEAPRLHFGLGVDLMRRSANAWIAWPKPASKVVGYILGYEAVLQSDNARDLSLRDICGTDALNYLFEGATRVFYEDTLCVDPRCRRQQIAQKLSFALIDDFGNRPVHPPSQLPLCGAHGVDHNARRSTTLSFAQFEREGIGERIR